MSEPSSAAESHAPQASASQPATSAAAARPWTRIKEHKVLQWSVAYLGVALALAHGQELLAHTYHWSELVGRMLMGALIVGFPVATTLAWYHGHKGVTRVSTGEMTVVSVLLVIGAGLLIVLVRVPGERPAEAAPPLIAQQLATVDTSRELVSSPTYQPPAASAVFTPPPHSVAVLPFTNLSGDPQQEYFSDGISEELINALVHIDALEVVARTSSFSFKGKSVDIATIARKLNCAAILEGSIRRSGNTVRITVQLINTVNGFHMWSQDYDRELRNILALQTDIAATVAQQLQARLLGNEAALIELGGTRNVDAYDAYLRGRQILSGSHRPEVGRRDALAAFDRAIALDPNYAMAYAERAWLLHTVAASSSDPGSQSALREQARGAAERSIALAPNLGRAHAALGSILAFAFFNYADAAPQFEHALALAPGDAEVQSWFAFYAADLGHFEAATIAAQRGVSLDPLNPWSHGVLGSVLGYARRYKEALAAYQEALLLRPDWRGIEGNRAQTILALGQPQQAREQCESPMTAMEEDDRHRCLALAYHLLGNQQRAENELRQLQKIDGDGGAGEYAGIYAQWGNATAALQWLTKAEKRRDPSLWTLKVDWHLDPIRNEPQFKALLRRMNFPP